MSRLLARAALSAVVLAACAGLSGPDGPRVSVSLNLQASITPAPVFMADLGGRRVEVRTAAGPGGASVAARGPRYGEVPVRAALVGVGGDTLAAVAFTHRLERDTGHWVSGVVGRSRPQGFCIGTVVATPLRGGGAAPGDSLFVLYGGLPDGAVC